MSSIDGEGSPGTGRGGAGVIGHQSTPPRPPDTRALITARPVRKRRRVDWKTPATLVGRSLLVILLVTIAVTLLLHLAPGSIAGVILGDAATPESVAALEEKLGLDRPLWEQYLTWLLNALQGDLGVSPLTNQPVMAAVLQRLPVTLEIALLALIMSLVMAMAMAIVAAAKENSRFDRGANALSAVLLSIPAFVAGPVLIYIFAIQLGLFPILGWSGLDAGLGANLRAALLPALAIAVTEIASFYRVLRADLIGTLREDFVGAARAKGMSNAYVMLRHALRPSSISLVTIAGINLGRLIGGTVIVETLFALPGLGQLLATSIMTRDIVTVQGVVTFIAVGYVLINTVVDLSYRWFDPRMRKRG